MGHARPQNRSRRCATRRLTKTSLKLRVLGLGLLQDGDVGVGVFPEREEVFLGGERTDTGRIGIRFVSPEIADQHHVHF